MSDAIDPETPLTIDVVSDVVCPWCYVGKRRLERALALRPERVVELRFRPFQLDATIPSEGLDRQDYMRKKFGSLDRLSEVHKRLEDIGSTEGIDFHFKDIKRSPNTLEAHRLIGLAHGLGTQDKMVEFLFDAYFVRGLDIGDRGVLATIAAEAGLDRDEALKFLESGELADRVRREIETAQELGIQGVPFFIFGGRYAVSGAEAPEVIADAMDKAAEPPAT